MKQKIIGFIVFIFYRIYSLSFRYKIIFDHEEDKKIFFHDLKTKEPHSGNLIYAFYHQQELALFPYFRGTSINAMVSKSKDGEIMATVLKLFGFGLIRGSSSKRAIAGFIECLKKVKKGYKITMAVDGPRGPIYKVKEGVPTLSQKSGRPIVPLSANPIKAKCFEKSWNKILFPYPFTKIIIRIGKIDFYKTQNLQKKLDEIQ